MSSIYLLGPLVAMTGEGGGKDPMGVSKSAENIAAEHVTNSSIRTVIANRLEEEGFSTAEKNQILSQGDGKDGEPMFSIRSIIEYSIGKREDKSHQGARISPTDCHPQQYTLLPSVSEEESLDVWNGNTHILDPAPSPEIMEESSCSDSSASEYDLVLDVAAGAPQALLTPDQPLMQPKSIEGKLLNRFPEGNNDDVDAPSPKDVESASLSEKNATEKKRDSSLDGVEISKALVAPDLRTLSSHVAEGNLLNHSQKGSKGDVSASSPAIIESESFSEEDGKEKKGCSSLGGSEISKDLVPLDLPTHLPKDVEGKLLSHSQSGRNDNVVAPSPKCVKRTSSSEKKTTEEREESFRDGTEISQALMAPDEPTLPPNFAEGRRFALSGKEIGNAGISTKQRRKKKGGKAYEKSSSEGDSPESKYMTESKSSVQAGAALSKSKSCEDISPSGLAKDAEVASVPFAPLPHETPSSAQVLQQIGRKNGNQKKCKKSQRAVSVGCRVEKLHPLAVEAPNPAWAWGWVWDNADSLQPNSWVAVPVR